MKTTFSLLIVSFNSGLGAYDKAVVKDNSGEIIGKVISNHQSKISFNSNSTVTEPFPPGVHSHSVHGLPHTFKQLSGVHCCAAEGQRAGPQHHNGDEGNTRHLT